MKPLPMLSKVLTPTRLKAFRRCAREHHYLYELGYRPTVEAEALRFGRLMHDALAAWWSTSRLDAALAVLDAAASVTDPFELVKARLLVIGYHARWSEQPLDVLAVKAEFRAPVVDPATDTRSRTWVLGGRIDVIVRDRRDGLVRIVEIRTTSEDIDAGSDYRTRLRLDAQVGANFVGANALGYDVVGCVFDLIRKPGLRPLKATPLESRRFTKDGRLYAAQRDRDETPEEYGARITEDIAADPDAYFARPEVLRTPGDVREHRLDIWELGREIRENALDGRIPRNTDSCVRYGRTCGFLPVCSGEASIEDATRFARVDHVHPELTADFKLARKGA
jgi:hypothetical protein